MTVLKKIKSHPGVVVYFKELPFYTNHIEKPKVKHLENVDLLSELFFFFCRTECNKNKSYIWRYAMS